MIEPTIDDLLAKTDSKYTLVIYAAKRARQINAYYSQLGEGLLEYVGPLVDTHVQREAALDRAARDQRGPADLRAPGRGRRVHRSTVDRAAAGPGGSVADRQPPGPSPVLTGARVAPRRRPAASPPTRPASCSAGCTESGHDVQPSCPPVRRAAVRRRAHLGGAVRPAGADRRLGRRARGPARPDRPARPTSSWSPRPPPTCSPRPRHGSPTTCSPTPLLTARCPVRVRPGDAHRDVGAPRHPGQRRHPARPAALVVVEPAVGPAHRRRHRQGPAARAGRDLRAWPRLLLAARGALPRDLAGRHVVVTAGGTREPLDPVRFLGNRSSGRQGYALARAAAAAAAPRSRWSPPTSRCPTRPAPRWSGSRPPQRAARRRRWPPPATPTRW